MPLFNVTVLEHISHAVYIEADNATDAMEAAQLTFDRLAPGTTVAQRVDFEPVDAAPAMGEDAPILIDGQRTTWGEFVAANRDAAANDQMWLGRIKDALETTTEWTGGGRAEAEIKITRPRPLAVVS